MKLNRIDWWRVSWVSRTAKPVAAGFLFGLVGFGGSIGFCQEPTTVGTPPIARQIPFDGERAAIRVPDAALESHVRTVPEEAQPLPLETDSQAVSSNSIGITLSELEDLAMAQHPAIGRALARVEAARGRCLQAGLPPNPQIGYEGQQLGSGGLAEQQGITFSQEIIRGGKLQLSRELACQELARAEQELAIERMKVQTDVRMAYYNARAGQMRSELSDKLLGVSEASAAAVEALLRIKEANRADVLQAQLEVENARILGQSAHQRREAAASILRALVGDRELDPAALNGDICGPPLDLVWEDVLTTLRSASPEVSLALTEVCRARAAWERARAEPIPNLNLQAVINVIDNGIGGQSDGGLALSFPLPVLNRNQGAIWESRQEWTAAEHAVELVQRDLHSRLALVFERFANAKYQVERYQSTIQPAAEEALQVANKLYEAGETNYLALLTAQRSYFQVHLNQLDAVLALRTAEAEIDGFLLSGSLDGSR